MTANAKPDFVIEDAPEVKFGKDKEPNPYAPHIAALIGNAPADGETKGKAVTFTPYPIEGKNAQQMYEYVCRKIRNDIPKGTYTVRTLLREDGRVSFWLTPPIVRKPKTKTETVEGAATELASVSEDTTETTGDPVAASGTSEETAVVPDKS